MALAPRLSPWLLAACAAAGGLVEGVWQGCPGSLDFAGKARASVISGGWQLIGGANSVEVIPAGWNTPGGVNNVEVFDAQVVPHINSRAYLGDSCSAGTYDHLQYVGLNLLGKTLRYSVDLAGAGCGCVAALSLTSMRQNPRPSCGDFYCNANALCGEPCAEVGLQEANRFAWHSTLHASGDAGGHAGGYGGKNGPRDWEDSSYAPGGSCVDTSLPFQVAASFHTRDDGGLASLEMRLSQEGRSCALPVELRDYGGMAELSAALARGMTPVISYWNSTGNGWLDGGSGDGHGRCPYAGDHPKTRCSETVMFYDFAIDALEKTPPTEPPHSQPPPVPWGRGLPFKDRGSPLATMSATLDVLAQAWLEANAKVESRLGLGFHLGGVFTVTNLMVLFTCALICIVASLCLGASCCSALALGLPLLACACAGILLLGSASLSLAAPEPVSSFWSCTSKERTLHFPAGWPDEEQKSVQFYAYRHEAPGTEAVWSFWNKAVEEHTFHFLPAWPDEEPRGIQFYAPRAPQNGTEAVYDFWSDGNMEHTFHFMPAWGREKPGRAQFHAWRDRHPGTDAVWDFWSCASNEHTFHFPPAWPEKELGVELYAYRHHVRGSEAVFDFWDAEHEEHTFHLKPAVGKEAANSAQFYAFRGPRSGTEAVWEFWNAKLQRRTMHFLPAGEDEEARSVHFYAHRFRPHVAVRAASLVILSASAAMAVAACAARRALKVRGSLYLPLATAGDGAV